MQNFLPDPALEVRNANGAVIAANDGYVQPSENMNTFPADLQTGDFANAATGLKTPTGNYAVIVHAFYGGEGTPSWESTI